MNIFKNLFVSKYLKKILIELANLEKAKAELLFEKNGIKQTLDPKKFIHYSICIDDLNKQINLLKRLL